VEAYIQRQQPKDYDRAMILLTYMHDLAVRQGREAGFRSALAKIRKTHTAKESFLRLWQRRSCRGNLQIIVIRQETLAPKSKTKTLLSVPQLRTQNLLKIICAGPKPWKLG
jgi:hypothetical protein